MHIIFCNKELCYGFFAVPFGQNQFSGWAISFCRWAAAHPVNMLCLGLPECSDTIFPEQLCILILSHWLRLMSISLITARHLVFLALIPVHNLSHCAMSLLIQVLNYCWAFNGDMIDGFIFLLAFSTFRGDVSSINGSSNVSCS